MKAQTVLKSVNTLLAQMRTNWQRRRVTAPKKITLKQLYSTANIPYSLYLLSL